MLPWEKLRLPTQFPTLCTRKKAEDAYKGASIVAAGMEGHSCYFKYSAFHPTLPPSTPVSIYIHTIKQQGSLHSKETYYFCCSGVPIIRPAKCLQVKEEQTAERASPFLLSSIVISRISTVGMRNDKWVSTCPMKIDPHTSPHIKINSKQIKYLNNMTCNFETTGGKQR